MIVALQLPDGGEVIVRDGRIPRAGEWVIVRRPGQATVRLKAEPATYSVLERADRDGEATMMANVGLQVP